MSVSFARSEPVRGAPRSRGTVLVVEDPLVSKLVKSVLLRHAYDVKMAAAGEAAALLLQPDSDIGILLTNSPGGFLDFAARVPLLYLTSSPDAFLQAAFHSCRVVLKPFVPEDLVRAVGDLADAS
jgi:DNA-binding response OmpR family regulator